MAIKTEEIKVRVSPQVKANAQAVFDHWNMSMSQAVGLFLAKVADVGGLPFDLTLTPQARAELWSRAHEWKSDEERREHEEVYLRLHATASEPLRGDALGDAVARLIAGADA